MKAGCKHRSFRQRLTPWVVVCIGAACLPWLHVHDHDRPHDVLARPGLHGENRTLNGHHPGHAHHEHPGHSPSHDVARTADTAESHAGGHADDAPPSDRAPGSPHFHLLVLVPDPGTAPICSLELPDFPVAAFLPPSGGAVPFSGEIGLHLARAPPVPQT